MPMWESRLAFTISSSAVTPPRFEIFSQNHVLPPSPITVALLGSQDIKQGTSARQIEHNLHLIYRYLPRHKVRQLIAGNPLAAPTLDPPNLRTPANFTPAQESVRQTLRQWILHQPGITVIDADRDGDLLPCRVRVDRRGSQQPRPRGKNVRRQRLERPAYDRRAPGAVHPRKPGGLFRKPRVCGHSRA